MTADPKEPPLSANERQGVEQLLLEFEQDWTPSRLDEWLVRLPPPGSPQRGSILLGLAEIDLRRQWQAGQQPTVEDYLHRFPELGTTETVAVELVLVEYLARERAGLRPRPELFAQRFPGKQAELERLVEPVSSTSPALADLGSPSSRSNLPRLELQSLHDHGEAETQPLPEHFGRYRIIRRLGQGGMGTVYLAADTRLDRQVALKVPRFAPGTNPENLQRFYREARATAVINHPNLCPLYDIDEIDGVPYLTMPYIDGWPLTRFTAREKRLSQVAVAAIVRKIALAVAEAHKHGIIHRDLKPSNIMINKRGEPIVMDFGLARWVKNDREDVRLTQNGSILGAPVYMSPEQVYGDVEAMGPACDIYSLGVILYELLTCQLPFEGLNTTAVLAKSLMLEPTPPSKHRAGLDPELEAICLQAMAKQIPQRHHSMSELAEALGEYLKRAQQTTQTGSRTNGTGSAVAATSPRTVPEHRQAVKPESQAPARKVESRIESADNRTPAPRLSLPQAAPRPRWPLFLAVLLGVLAVALVPLLVVWHWASGPARGALVLHITPDGAEVDIRLGEDPFPRDRLSTAVPLAPGEYRLVIRGTAIEEITQTIHISSGVTERLDINLRPRGPEPRLPMDAPYPPVPGNVLALAASPLGIGLSGGSDFLVRLWNLDRHRILTTLSGHRLPITGVAVSRNGEVGVSCSGDLTVRVWDLKTQQGRLVLTGHNDWLRCVAVDGMGTRAVSGDDEGRLFVWDTRDGQRVRTLDGHAAPVRAVLLSPDGKRAVSGSEDGTVRHWDVETGKALRILGSSGDPILSLAWSPSGKVVAGGTASGIIRVWNLDTGRESPHLRGHTGPVRGLVFTTDNNRLCSAGGAGSDTSLRVWDVSKSTLLHLTGYVPGGSNALVTAPDGVTLLSAGDEGILRGWDPARKLDRPVPPGPSLAGPLVRRFDSVTAVERMTVTPDGIGLLLAGYDGAVRLCDTASGTVRKTLRGPTRELRAIAVSPDGRLAAGGGVDRQIRVWDLQTGTDQVLEGHTDTVWALNFLPDGKRLVSGSADRSVIIWDLPTRMPLHRLTGHADTVRAVVPTPDGKFLLSAGLDGMLKLWNVETGQTERFQATEGAAYVGLAILPDGKRAVTAGRDRILRVWDLVGPKITVLQQIHAPGPKPISALGLSPCGRWIAVALEDFQVQRWHTATLQMEQRQWNAHSRIPTSLVFTPDGRMLVSASADRAVKFWGMSRAQADPGPVTPLQTLAEPASRLVTTVRTTLESAALSPDGTTVVAGGSDKNVLVWDVATGKARAPLVGHTARVHGVCFLPDGRRIITGSWDNTARLWNTDTGKTERIFEGHTGPIIRVAVSGNGRYLLTGSQDRTARVWEVATGRVVRTLEGHGEAVWSVAISQEGLLAVTGSYDRSVRWWDLATGRPLGGYVSAGEIHAVALSPDETRIIAAGKDRAIEVIDLATGKPIARLSGHEATIAGLAYAPDGRHVASCGDDRTARIWNLETGREVLRLTDFRQPCWSVAFSADGKRLLTGSNEPAAMLWDLPASLHAVPVGLERVPATLPTKLDRLALSPDGMIAAVCGYDKAVRLLDRESGREIRALANLKGQPRYAAFSPDGKQLLACGDGGLVQLWNVADGKPTRTLSGHTRTVWMGAFSRDGKRVMTGGQDPVVLVHDAATGAIVQRLEVNPRGVHCLAFLPDGKRAVLGGLDGSLGIWDLDSGEELQRWYQHPRGLAISTLVLTPDGRRVITGGYDGSVRFWEVAGGELLHTGERHNGQVWSVTPDPQGQWVASSGIDGTIRLWDATTGEPVYSLEGHVGGVPAVRFTPDGRRLLSCGLDGSVRVWALPVR